MSAYTAKSLEDIAEMFEAFAQNVRQSPLQNTKTAKNLASREAYVWDRAAAILRITTIAP